MSRSAYESYFGTSAPANAQFFADISYWQSASVWDDLKAWAYSVCIRTSYGGSGDDGRQDEHFNRADEVGFTGPKGTYHYVIPNSGRAANLSNYLDRSAPFVDRTTYDMLDFEEAPVPGFQFIDDFCDAVEQNRQRNCFIYGGKSYMDQAGAIKCPVTHFWSAHYPGRSANPWQPTADWNSWGAPLMPNQYGAVDPGVWQWSSTAQGYSLDLDITTMPEMMGPGGMTEEDDFMGALDTTMQYDIYNNLKALHDELSGRDFNALGLLRDIFNNTTWNEQRAAELMTLVRLIPNIGSMDIEALASSIAVKLTPTTTGGVDYTKIRAIVVDTLNSLTVAAK